MIDSRRIAIACAVAFVLAANVAASANAGSSSCSGARAGSDGWTHFGSPTFAGGSSAITDYALDPVAPTTMLVTNGMTVMRTADAGCTWTEVFAFPATPSREMPFSSIEARVDKVVIAHGPGGASRTYLVVSQESNIPHVIVSEGSRWRVADTGLPPIGNTVELEVAPSNPDVAYLMLREAGRKTVVVGTDDAGGHWTLRPSPTDLTDQDPVEVANRESGLVVTPFTNLEIDPLNAQELWASSDLGVWHSLDGGRHFLYAFQQSFPVGPLTVAHAPGSPPRVIAFDTTDSVMFLSTTSGRKWSVLPTPGIVDSVARGATALDLVVSVPGFPGVYRLNPLFRWTQIKKEPALYDIQGSPSGPTFAGRASDGLYGFSGLLGLAPGAFLAPSPFATLGCTDDPLGASSAPPLPDVPPLEPGVDPRLEGLGKPVTLGPGESATRHLSLRFPPEPAPLDVYFLVDTTGSMGPAICGLRVGLRQIVQDLSDQGLDVHFGVGEYRDYQPPYGQAGDFVYRRVLDVGPSGQRLADAIAGLRAQGGGDGPEAQWAGLYQAATGAGQDTAQGASPWDVAPGQQASFRPDALKVVINVSDTTWHEETSYPGPAPAAVVKALEEKGILQLGIAVAPVAREPLESAARATGAIARRPVDCDGNGTPDVAKGLPLVCGGATNLGPAIVNLLKAIRDEQPVTLLPARGGEVVDTVTPSVYPAVNLKRPNRLPFDVRFTCTRALAGRKIPVTLAAAVAREDVASVQTSVRCRDLVVPVVPTDGARLESTAAVVVPPPIPPPPPPPISVPDTAPGPVPQPRVESQAQAQSQGQAQLQGVVVPQHQEQPQVALVHAVHEVREQIAMENSMTRLNQQRDPLGAVKFGLSVGAASIVMLWGYALAIRNQMRTAQIGRSRR